jgi:apolipoprotein N-acyltransferase
VNVALAAAFLVTREKRGAMLAAALAAAAVLQAGSLIETPAVRADHAALLVQQNIPVSANWTPAYFQQTLSDLIDLSEKSAAGASSAAVPAMSSHASSPPPQGKIELVVWPESPAPFITGDARFRAAMSGMARTTSSWVLAGSIGTATPLPGETTSQMFNSAVLIAPGGDWTARYDKAHLVPFGEYLPFPSLFSFAGGLTKEVGEFEHGTSRAALDAGGTRLGVFICYESIFPDEVRQFANNGAQVFVNISNDAWYGDSGAYAQHLNQTRMRAIENNRWLLSDTDTGVTASIDPWGKVVAKVPRKERTTLTAPYALTSATTFYTRHGDWFAYVCAIISLVALLSRFLFQNSQSQKKADASS